VGPGIGKTPTAESVAELAETPPCSDRETRSMEVELFLKGYFFLYKSRNYVPLLDDADAFLKEV
jgi:hypothetical protein